MTIFNPVSLINTLKHIMKPRVGPTKIVAAMPCDGCGGPVR
jgi:hypothetical protein